MQSIQRALTKSEEETQKKLRFIIENNKHTKEYANGGNYYFVYNDDGWVSIIQVTDYGVLVPCIQAYGRDRAKSWISLTECINVPVQEI